MATFPDVSITDLQAAYAAWPGGSKDKAALWALILRIRIERAAANLPRTIIAVPPDISHVERRLYLSIGEPGLTPQAQIGRMRTIAAALGAYQAICELLHGRNPDPTPPLQDVEAWTAAVDSLELEFGISQATQPAALLPPALTATAPA